jgi:primosomal protein N' (replication factor Y)
MLAKGHDYPNITLVGILDADQALFSSFYRAPERLVQTVLQVSGRAGRATRTGQALLQTAFPLHPLMQNLCVQSYSELVQDLMQERKILGFPPYARVVTLVVDAMDLEAAMQRLQKLVKPIQQCSAHEEIKLVGPIPALMTRRVGRYRAQLSVMANDIRTIRIMLHELMPKIIADRNTHKSRLVIEVDPLDL